MLEMPLFNKPNYYVNIIGDYLIEVHLDKKSEEKINRFFKTFVEWTPQAREKLEAIVSSHGRTKLVVSRNAKKAARLVALLEAKPRHKSGFVMASTDRNALADIKPEALPQIKRALELEIDR
jgi:hypothetical protein